MQIRILVALYFCGASLPIRSAPCELPGDKLGDMLPPPPQRHCPLHGVPEIRPPDACASGGGDFLSARASGYHRAYDLNAIRGADVFAAQDGCVALATQANWGGVRENEGMGKTVVLRHEGGTYSVYGHLDTVIVALGARVAAGQKIGTVGTTGNAKCLADKNLRPHLHFAVIQHHTNHLFMEGYPIRQASEWANFWQGWYYGDSIANGTQRPDLLLAGMRCWCRSTECLQTNQSPTPKPGPPPSVTAQ